MGGFLASLKIRQQAAFHQVYDVLQKFYWLV